MTQFRSAICRGALYIDSRQLLDLLTPIPSKSIKEMHSMLKQLQWDKITRLRTIFKYCTKRLTKEPTELEEYVDFCDFIKTADRLAPYLRIEVLFLDELDQVLELFSNIPPTENEMHQRFSQLKQEQQNAVTIKDLYSDKFTYLLQQQIHKNDRKLQKYRDLVSTFPTSISQCEVSVLLPDAKKIQAKVENLAPQIDDLKECQRILELRKNDFASFDQVSRGSIFMTELYTAVFQYTQINTTMTTIPLNQVPMNHFAEEVNQLGKQIDFLLESAPSPNQLLNEIAVKVGEVRPYLEQLTQLSAGKMQRHHWELFFEECGQPNAYYPQIKVYELLKLGVLRQKEKIVKITSASQGESQLEGEFQAIRTHWNEVFLPILDNQPKGDDVLLLGDLFGIFGQIADSQVTLQRMLCAPYVKGIEHSVLELSSQLENVAQILDEWQHFQSNWSIISSLFSQEDVRTLLPSQASKFQIVKRRWSLLVQNAKQDLTLFKVCSFPSLLDLLKENNQTLQNVL